MQKYLSFTVGGLDLGVDMTSVVSIEQGGALAVENPGELTSGTVSFGGQALPLYNVSGLLGRKGSDVDRGFDSKVLIVRTASGTIALWVDRVGSVMEAIDNTVSELPPVFSGMAGAFFSRVLLGQDGLILLVNPDAVAPTALWVQMTRVEAEACEALAMGDAVEELSPDLGFDAVADLVAEPEACDEAAMDAAELSEALSPEAVAPLDMAFPDVLEETLPDLGFDAVAGLVAEPETCDEATMDAAEISEAVSPALDLALPDALEEAASDLEFDAMADLAAEPEACDEPEVDAVERLEPASDHGLDVVADLADKADGSEDDEANAGQGCFVYVETPEGLLADEQEAPLDLVEPDEAAECVGETCPCEAGGDAGVESPEADAGMVACAEAAETPCPDAGPVADDEPVIDLVDPFPEDLVQAVEAEASARLQEHDTLSSLMEKAITPDLLERVVDRVVTSMITELVSDLTSDVADSQKDQETSPLY